MCDDCDNSPGYQLPAHNDPREVAQRIINVITYNPQAYDQTYWFDTRSNIYEKSVDDVRDDIPNLCGTTACTAGWGAILTVPSGSHFIAPCIIRLPTGAEVRVRLQAQHALGITSGQGNWLFRATRSKEEVLEALHEIQRTGVSSAPEREM